MNPTVALKVNLFRAVPFDLDFGEKIHTLFSTWKYPPNKFGISEPLRNSWTDDSKKFLHCWREELKRYFGTMMMERTLKSRWESMAVIQYGPREKNHYLSLFGISDKEFSSASDEILSFCDHLFDELQFDFGFFCTDDEYHHKNINRNVPVPGGIRPKEVVGMEWPDCIPGFYWANYYSHKYFDQGFGQDIDNLADITRLKNGMRVMTSGSVFAWESPEAISSANGAMEALGADWFFTKETGMPAKKLQTDRSLFAHPASVVD